MTFKVKKEKNSYRMQNYEKSFCPTKNKRKPMTILAMRYKKAILHCPLFIRRMVSDEKVENVVNAPQSPTVSMRYGAPENPAYFPPKAVIIPNRKHPMAFTVNVDRGDVTNSPTMYLRVAPTAPPIIMNIIFLKSIIYTLFKRVEYYFYVVSSNPTIPTSMSNANDIRIIVAESPKHIIPIINVPIAPIPVQII